MDQRAQKVLIVESDLAVRQSLKFVLETEGFVVKTYPDGHCILADPPIGSGVIVIDHDLPDLTGLDTLRALRSNGVVVPAILLTTAATPLLRDRAAGVKARVIEKPFLDEDLSDAIRSAFEEDVT
jgi:FixJ family two-component response regulator